VVPADLGVHPRVYPAVDRAVAMSQHMSWVARSYHRLFGWKVHATIPVKYVYPPDGVPPVIARLARSIDEQPRNANVSASADDMSIVPVHAKAGRSIDKKRAVALVMHALRTRASSVRIPVRVVKPQVTDSALGKTITVDLSTNTLHLYNGFGVERTYPVATAIFPFSTPIGTWHVVQKEDMPSWVNPGTPWAASMPATIPPGPSNPLGLRALALDAPGVLIHGTPEDYSVGHYASHGCIRMHESDAIALYPLVPAGTKVIIFGAPPWGASTVAGQVAGF
jgi:lipoprotein-anchoring transpeptidase ErfK/SrfK